MCLADSLHVHELQCQHGVDVALAVRLVLPVLAELIDFGKGKCLGGSDAQHLGTLGSVEELTLGVQQLQGIPLAGVVRGGEDDASAGAGHGDGQLGGGCRGQADVEHVEAHAHERAADTLAHHLARDAGVASHNDVVGRSAISLADERGVCRRELGDVKGVEPLAGHSAYGAADA